MNNDVMMFWLRVGENFFKEQPIRKLERINKLFSLAYIKACLYSLRFAGYLIDPEGNDLEDWFIEDEFGVDAGDFIKALIDCKLARLENDRILINHIEELKGKITLSAIRKRKQRNKE